MDIINFIVDNWHWFAIGLAGLIAIIVIIVACTKKSKKQKAKIVKEKIVEDNEVEIVEETEEVVEPIVEAKPEKKAPAKKYHIAQRSEDGLWQVKAEGAEKALKLFKTQQEAIDYAKKVAGNQEGYIVIHKKDGSFRKLTY